MLALACVLLIEDFPWSMGGKFGDGTANPQETGTTASNVF